LSKSLIQISLVLSLFAIGHIFFGGKSLAGNGNHLPRYGNTSQAINLSHMGAKGVVKERMQLMKSYAASMKNINKEFSDKTSVNYVLINLEATNIAVSSHKILELFPSGSGGGVSEASPKIWLQPADFKKIVEGLNQAAQRLAQATSTGVPNLVIEKFRALGGTCKNCHREYRVKKKG